jgi:hypothetical protein
MTRPRLTIAQAMTVVLYVGFGFAALRNADELWASATFTLAYLLISVAPLGALARKGRARMAWAGFAVFGWSRLLVGALPLVNDSVFGRMVSPGLLSEQGLTRLLPYIANPQGISEYQIKVFVSLEIILFGLIGAVVGRLLAATDDRQNP